MASRGRPKGSRNKPKAQTADTPHSANYSEEQEHALLARRHGPAFARALTAKKTADKALRDVVKVAKEEGVAVSDMKLWLDLQEPAGEEKLRAEFERKLRIARWSGMAVGEQAALFPEIDRTPLVERAQAAGKRAGIEGKGSGDSPHDLNTEAGRAWEAGRVEGMSVQIQTGIKPLEKSVDASSTLIKANRPHAAPVTSNDGEDADGELEPETEAPDDEGGETEDASVDGDVPYSERWKAANVPAQPDF